jgi:hypothetical protein
VDHVTQIAEVRGCDITNRAVPFPIGAQKATLDPNNPTQCSILHSEEAMKQSLSLMVAAASVLVSQTASAQISDGVVKLGVLNDMSSLYADASGRGGVLAAQMAVEDFGGKVSGLPSRLSPAIIRTSPMSAPALRGNGLTRIT